MKVVVMVSGNKIKVDVSKGIKDFKQFLDKHGIENKIALPNHIYFLLGERLFHVAESGSRFLMIDTVAGDCIRNMDFQEATSTVILTQINFL